MGKLSIIDSEQFILGGEFEKIRTTQKAVLYEQSVIDALEKYKEKFISPGLAVGELSDGFLTMPTADGEQVIEQQKPPAFMIIDIDWNPENKSIFGKVILLDSEDGIKIKESLKQGMDCYITSGEIESYMTKEEETSRVLNCISEIKGFKMSIMNFHSNI